MDSLIFGFVLLLLVVAAVSLFVFHARPPLASEQFSKDVDLRTVQLLALAATAGGAGGDCAVDAGASCS